MSRVWYIFFLIIMAFFVLMLMFIMFGYHSEQTMQVDTLQTAVNDSLQTSRDDSARLFRGIYAINPRVFINTLKEYNINDLGGFGIIQNSKQHKQPGFVAVRYIPDTSSTDSKNTKNNKTYKSNAGYARSYYNTDSTSDNTFSGLFTGSNASDNHPYPIRGVQVIMLPYKDVKKIGLETKGPDHDSNDSSVYKTNVGIVMKDVKNGILKPANKFVVTMIIQDNDGDPNGGSNNGGDMDTLKRAFTAGENEENKDRSLSSKDNQVPQNSNSSNVADLTDENE